MTLHSFQGATNGHDLRVQPIGTGTIGGAMITPHGLAGSTIASVVDDADPSILYGMYRSGGYTGTAVFDIFANTPFLQTGTQTILGGLSGNGVQGSAAQLKFSGTTIGILASSNPNSGKFNVYIDGVLTAGRVPVFAGIHTPSSINSPALTSTDTSLTTYNPGAFPTTGGRILIGKELIDYTSRSGTLFSGLIRGAGGTLAQNHYTDETVYLWDYGADLYASTDYSTKRLVYYNPLLAPGDHIIDLVAVTSDTSGYARVFFDGFVVGPLLGAKNVFTQIGTVTVTTTTDGNGHADIGQFTQVNSDVAAVSVIGMTQTSPSTETTNTTIFARLGVRYQTDGTPYYYIHNGPLSTNVTLVITFAYIGDST